jgi:hypothetical protein
MEFLENFRKTLFTALQEGGKNSLVNIGSMNL